jgi:hypothetical protein
MVSRRAAVACEDGRQKRSGVAAACTEKSGGRFTAAVGPPTSPPAVFLDLVCSDLHRAVGARLALSFHG